MSNNPPFAEIQLTEEEHKFLLDNCDSNIAFGLAALSSLSRPNAEKMVAMMEQFKVIRAKLQRAVT